MNLVVSALRFFCKVTLGHLPRFATPRKLLDMSKITSLGSAPNIGLSEGIWTTCEHWLAIGGGSVQPMSDSARDVA